MENIAEIWEKSNFKKATLFLQVDTNIFHFFSYIF